MNQRVFIAAVLGGILVCERHASACGSCSIDRGSDGQTLMLVAMLALPLLVGFVGFRVIRGLLKKQESAL